MKRKKKIIPLFLFVIMLLGILCTGLFASLSIQNDDMVFAKTNSYNIAASGTYLMNDNTGYHPYNGYNSYMSFGSTTIGNLTIGGVNSKSKYNGTLAYAQDGGNQVTLSYALKYSKNNIAGSVWNLSSDTATSVNDINLNANIKYGSVLLQKKRVADSSYSTVVKSANAFNNGNWTSTLSGEDVNDGCYYKVTVAYEIYRNYSVKHKILFITWYTTETEYKNCLEVYTFFVGRDGCNIQIKELATKDYSAYSDDESTAKLIEKGDTLQNGSVTTSGFKLDYLGNKSYTVTYSHNNKAYQNAYNGQEFKTNGLYKIKVKNLFGETKETNVYVFNGGLDKGYATYFGDNFVQGKRVANLDVAIPTYQSGAILKINAVGQYIPSLYGTVTNQTTGYSFNISKSSSLSQFTLSEEGVYLVDLYNADQNLAGSSYNYSFAFIILNQSTYPSINYGNIVTSINVSDYDSKMIQVSYTMPSGYKAYICFDKENYVNAYQFAYDLEKMYLQKISGGYRYNGVIYTNEMELVNAINEVLETKVSFTYINPLFETFYMDENSLTASILIKNLNFNNDIYLTTVSEQNKLVLRNNIVGDDFKFVQLGDYETKNIVAQNDQTGVRTKLKYNTKIGNQLSVSGSYTITETNCYGESITYKIVFCKDNQSKLYLNVDGQNIVVDNNNYQIINASTVVLSQIINNYDKDGIVILTNLTTHETNEYSNEEISGLAFEEGNNVLTMIDRSGNIINIVLNINTENDLTLAEALNQAKVENAALYAVIVAQGVSNLNNVYAYQV